MARGTSFALPFENFSNAPPPPLVGYFVKNGGNDALAGTSDALAWETIAKVNATVFAPDDHIYFKRGSTFRAKLVPKNNGAAGHPVTFSAYGAGADPIISGGIVMTGFANGGANIWDVALVAAASPYVVLVNNFRGNPVAARAACVAPGDWFWGANVLSVFSVGDPSGIVEAASLARVLDTFTNSCSNLTFNHICFRLTSDPTQGIYVRAPGLANVKFSYCEIAYHAGHGVSVFGSVSTSGVEFGYCNVHGSRMDGINTALTSIVANPAGVWIHHCHVWDNGTRTTSENNGIFGMLGNSLIEYNEINNNGLYNGGGGVLCHGIYGMNGDGAGWGSRGVARYNNIHHQMNGSGIKYRGSAEIYKNNIHENNQAGIGQDNNGVENIVQTIWSNLIWGNGHYGIIQGAGGGAGNISTNIFHNAFWDNGDQVTIYIGSTIEVLVVEDNIICSLDQRLIEIIAVPLVTIFVSYNCYFRADAGANRFRYVGVNYATLALWQVGTGLDIQSVYDNPLYKSILFPPDLRITAGSPAIGIGLANLLAPSDYINVAWVAPENAGAYNDLAP
jgi:hypothetical protein